MILYHGSNCDIQEIDLNKCKPNKDFGKGFYLTTLKEQAQRMASRVAKMFGGISYLNIYQFDDKIIQQNILNIKTFETPNEEWAKFVITNRNYRHIKDHQADHNIDNRYDIVIGLIANDDLALLFRQFSDGLISTETLINEMKFKKLTNQYSFHTNKAIAYLKKIGVEYV